MDAFMTVYFRSINENLQDCYFSFIFVFVLSTLLREVQLQRHNALVSELGVYEREVL
jgi:hypothetical protein